MIGHKTLEQSKNKGPFHDPVCLYFIHASVEFFEKHIQLYFDCYFGLFKGRGSTGSRLLYDNISFSMREIWAEIFKRHKRFTSNSRITSPPFLEGFDIVLSAQFSSFPAEYYNIKSIKIFLYASKGFLILHIDPNTWISRFISLHNYIATSVTTSLLAQRLFCSYSIEHTVFGHHCLLKSSKCSRVSLFFFFFFKKGNHFTWLLWFLHKPVDLSVFLFILLSCCCFGIWLLLFVCVCL